MAETALAEVVRFLHNACALHGTCALTDRELLDRFLGRRDESAFTFLVRRHGPMIFNLCRRLLGDTHEAEDVFQATFLVLVRHVRSIRRKESLASWLYGVAQRIGLRARAQSAARRRHERKASHMAESRSVDDLTLCELRSALDEEIGALPEKYRAPIILCYLEGQSHDQAAKELGWPKNTVSNRLARGSEVLRKKLIRRGIGLGAGALATTLAEVALAAPMPAMLTIKTIKAGAQLAAGKTVAGYLSAGVLALVEEAITGLIGLKAKFALMVLAIGLAASGARLASYGESGGSASPALRVETDEPPLKRERGAASTKKRTIVVDRYGDPLPEGAVARLGAKRFRHDGLTSALVYSGDGKYLVGCNFSGVVVWEAANGREAYRLPHYPASKIAISRDGAVLAASEPYFINKENRITLWQLRDGKKVRVYSMPENIRKGNKNASISQLSFLPGGKRLLLLFAGSAAIVNLGTGDFTALDGEGLQKLAVSSDGKTLAAQVIDGVGSVQLWDVGDGKRLRTVPANSRPGFGNAIAFSPDGKTLAIGGNEGVSLVDTTTGQELARLEAAAAGGMELAFTPDGMQLVSNHQVEYKIRVWDVAKRNLVRTIDGLAGPISYRRPALMALCPDGGTVALGTVWNVVKFWSVATGKELFTEYEGHFSQINSLAFAPNGKLLASAGGNGPIQLWDTLNWRRWDTVPGRSMAVSFSQTSRWLASGSIGIGVNADAGVRVWDVNAKKNSLAFQVPRAEDVYDLAFSPDERTLFTLEWNQTQQHAVGVRQWDVSTLKQEKAWTLDSFYMGAHLGQDGNSVFVATTGNSLDVLNLATGRTRHLIKAQVESIIPLATSRDNKVIASRGSGVPGRLCFWESASGRQILSLAGHQGNVTALAWSADSCLVASGDQLPNPGTPSSDQTIKIWDAYSGTERATFGGFKSNIWTLAFSPDGKSLVAGLQDSTILVFDVTKATSKPAPASNLNSAELLTHWSNLIADDAGKAFRSIATLVATPAQSMPLLQRHLAAASRANAADVEGAIANLNSESFLIRQAATKELLKIGAQVIPPMQKAMAGDIPLETRRRLEELINKLSDVPGPDTLRTIRAIMVLERIGSPESQGVLEALTRGAPGARETEEANASLERLSRRASKMP